MPPGPPLIAFTESGGRLWFGYPNDQISSLSASIAETFGMNEGVDVGVVRSINQVRGTIWIGGTTGLEYLKSGRFMPVNLVDGTKLEGVVGIVEGAGGDIWLNTTGGAFRLPRSEIHLLKTDPLHRVVTNQFTYLDRIPSLPDQIRPLPTALRRGDGPLYFATRASVVWTDPSKISLNSIPPNVVIRSVSADGREKVDPSGSELRVGAGGLTVKYTASSLVIPLHLP